MFVTDGAISHITVVETDRHPALLRDGDLSEAAWTFSETRVGKLCPACAVHAKKPAGEVSASFAGEDIDQGFPEAEQ